MLPCWRRTAYSSRQLHFLIEISLYRSKKEEDRGGRRREGEKALVIDAEAEGGTHARVLHPQFRRSSKEKKRKSRCNHRADDDFHSRVVVVIIDVIPPSRIEKKKEGRHYSKSFRCSLTNNCIYYAPAILDRAIMLGACVYSRRSSGAFPSSWYI